MAQDIPLVRELKKQGIHNAREYGKRFSRPGAGTIERYILGEQDPITSTGNWRAAPLKIASALNVDIEVLFPEAAEQRQQILDDLSNKALGDGCNMTLLHCVRCPKTAEDGARPMFVLVDLTCASCQFKVDLTGNRLLCGHSQAKNL